MQECQDGQWVDVTVCALRGMECRVIQRVAQCSTGGDADTDVDTDTDIDAGIDAGPDADEQAAGAALAESIAGLDAERIEAMRERAWRSAERCYLMLDYDGTLREIAEIKAEDLNAGSPEAAMRIIAGTARSMGLEVV